MTNFLLHFVLHFQMGDKNVFIKYLWLQAMTYFRNSSCKLRKLEKYLVKWSVSKQFPELWHLNVVCKDISFVAEKNYTLSFNEFFSQLNLRFLYISTFPLPAITNLLFLQFIESNLPHWIKLWLQNDFCHIVAWLVSA